MNRLVGLTLAVAMLVMATGCKKNVESFDAWLKGSPFGLASDSDKTAFLGPEIAARSTSQSLTWLELQLESAGVEPVQNGPWTFWGKKAEVDDLNRVRRVAVIVYKHGQAEFMKPVAAVRQDKDKWRPTDLGQEEAEKLLSVAKMML